ncbi:GNAT family N-acetyltransferase [Candidatus Daviesbacteria bacterium]|nr:GNAT family N-acetyltransferase [Candidatus Daviesbacteria bacterium]
MVKVSKATKRAIKKFNEEQWHGVDVEHYGKPVNWNEKEFVFKATEDGEIIGSITGKHESGVLYVGGLIVAQRARGKGIGKALMEKAEEFGKKEGAHKAHLITGKDWQAANFYEALGYVKVADLPKHHFKRDFAIYEKLI